MMETDWQVGRILALLDREKLADDTMVIFTSDNGPETTWKERAKRFQHQSNGPYREGKRSIYEGGHRVPMFVRWPAKVRAGVFCDQPICQTDLLATLADVTDQSLPANAGEDSVSFHDVLIDQGAKFDRAPIIHHSASGGFAIRDGDWKLVMETKAKKQERELYDLATDPSETQNVIDQNPAVANQLADTISDIVRQGRSTPGPSQENDTPWWDDLVWMDRF